MAKTPGQIEEYTPGHFRVRVFLGRDTDRKRQYLSETVVGSRKDAEKRLRKLLDDKDARRLVQPARRPLAAYLSEWLSTAAKTKVRPRTLAFYTDIIKRYIEPELGAIRMDKLNVIAVQRWVNGMQARKLSARTVRAAFGTLHTALRQAIKWRLLPYDPSADVELPKPKAVREPGSLTPQELGDFLAAAQGERLEAYFIMAVATACRPGELAALRWSDVDFDKSLVRIVRAMTKGEDGKTVFDEPKTDRGRRAIPIPQAAVEALRAHRQRQRMERVKADGPWAHPELVFTRMNGEPLDLANLRHRDLRRIMRRAKTPREHLEKCQQCKEKLWLMGSKKLCGAGKKLLAESDGITLYSLRHTAASVLLGNGVNVKAVSERLGHASTAFTMDVYVHSLPGVQEEAAAMLQALVFSPGKRA